MAKTKKAKIQKKPSSSTLSRPLEVIPKKRSLLDKILGVILRKSQPKFEEKKEIKPQIFKKKQIASTQNIKQTTSQKTKTKSKKIVSTSKKKLLQNKTNVSKSKRIIQKKRSEKKQNPTQTLNQQSPEGNEPTQLVSITPLPQNSTPSTFSEIEDEALKTKILSNKPIEDTKNSLEERKKIAELGKKVNANKKMTDYDRVLSAIQSKGSVVAHDLQKELNIPEKEFAQCYMILQKNGEIRVDYPLVGRMKLIAIKKKKSELEE